MNEQTIEYRRRLNDIFKYIEDHLDSDLSLEVIASIASFSPFHFHRIFKTITKETLNEYVVRKRVEKGAAYLVRNEEMSITSIAHVLGFTDNSSFTRSFRKFYQLSPSDFRIQNKSKYSKIGQQPSNYEAYLSIIDNLKNWFDMNLTTEVKQLEAMEVAYVSCIGEGDIKNGYDRLLLWAGAHQLLTNDAKMVTIYHDSFKITDAHKVRMSAGIVLTSPIKPEGEVGLTTIASGKYIIGHGELGLDEFENSWTALFMWMNDNGYIKAESDPYEVHYNDFNTHPDKKCIVDLCIPVK